MTFPDPAALKVFALTEILEKVLHHVANTTYAENSFGALPATRLFVLQRVNKAFQTTISQSPTLQQRMFLASTPVKKFRGYRNHMAEWLLQEIGVWKLEKTLCGPLRSLEFNFRPIANGRDIDKSKEASWRKIKLHCITNSGPIVIGLKDDDGHVVRRFAYEDGGMTLGRLHEGLERLIHLFEVGRVKEYIEQECARDEFW